MIAVPDLPHFIAAFNALSVVCIVLGWRFIRQGRRIAHRNAMVGALVFSGLFLAVYVVYHLNAGVARFGGEGVIRQAYFAFLIGHVILAIVITPLVPLTVWRAVRGRFELHRQIARWTLPVWLYVGVSGVFVYVMAIHLFPYQA